MKVIWQTKTRQQRNQVANYIGRQFGVKRRTRFLQEVRETAKKLANSPNIGQIDPLFADRPQTYRSVIINGLNKMVYRIDDDTIHIVAFWDTRREPEGQAAQVK